MDLNNFLETHNLKHLKPHFKAENIDFDLLLDEYEAIISEFGSKLKIGDRLLLKRAVTKYKEINAGTNDSAPQEAKPTETVESDHSVGSDLTIASDLTVASNQTVVPEQTVVADQSTAGLVHVAPEVQMVKYDPNNPTLNTITYYVQEYGSTDTPSTTVYAATGVPIEMPTYSQVDINLTGPPSSEKNFLPNWKRYGQIRPFPKIYHLPEFTFNQKIWLEATRSFQAKEKRKALRDIATALVNQFKSYFIWEMPSYCLRIACHKLIETYPHLIDESVTGYDKVYTYVTNKYRVVRRKLSDSNGVPEWVQLRKTPVYKKRKRSDESAIKPKQNN